MIRQHHERIDGSGYPHRLHGDEILLGARIIAVADTVEALTAHRPYRAGRGLRAALTEVERQRGSCFDAAVVDAFTRAVAAGRLAGVWARAPRVAAMKRATLRPAHVRSRPTACYT